MPEENTGQLKVGYRGEFAPEPYVAGRTILESQEIAREEADFGEALGLGIENQWITSALDRGLNRANKHQAVEGYKPEEELEEYKSEFNFAGLDYLKESKSPEQLRERASHLREDIKRHRALSAHGWKGTVAEMVAGVIDPAGIAVGFATGGYGASAKIGRLGRALKTGLAVSAEAAAFETALTLSDTQRDLDDIIGAAGASLVLGSAIGSIARSNPELKGIADAADAVDSAVAREAKSARVAAELEKATVPDVVTVKDKRVRLDSRVVDDKLATHRASLESRTKPQVFKGNKRQRKAAKKVEIARTQSSIDTLKAEIEEIKGTKVAHKARVASSFGAPRNASEALRNTNRAAMIDNMYDPKVTAREQKLSVVEERLKLLEGADAAAEELKAFDAMARPQKIRQVFGDNPPKLVDEVERQVKAMKQLDEVADEAEELSEKVAEEVAAKAEPTPAEKVQKADEAVEFVGPKQPAFTTGETMQEFMESIMRQMTDLPKPVSMRYLPKFLSDRLQGLFTTLDNSENLVFRGLGHMFFESPQGHNTPQMTAGILSAVHDNKIRFAIKNRYNEGFDAWSRANGRGAVKAAADKGRWREQFNNEVFLKIYDPDRAVQAGIEEAADGLRDGFSEALRIRKEAGELGFEAVEDLRTYVPIIFDGTKMMSAFKKHSKEDVLRALSQGYQTGKFKLSPKNSHKLAEMQYIRTMEGITSQRHAFDTVVSQAERQRFLEELRSAGFGEEVISDFIAGKEVQEMLDNVSNRSKQSMGINPTAKVSTPNGDLYVHELLNTNVAELSENYIREAAGGAAMAKKGFGTYQQALQVVDAAERYGINMGQDVTRTKTEAQMLRDGINMIYGKSIEANPKGGVEVATRRAREFTALIRLQMMGFVQAPEIARSLTELGVATNMKQIKGLGILRRRAVREGGKSSGDLSEPSLRELEYLLGYVGESNWDAPVIVREADFGEGAAGNELSRLYDNMVAYGMKANTVMSGFQAIQGGAEKIVAKSIHYRLNEMLSGARKMDSASLREVGLDDEFMADLQKFWGDNPKVVQHNGQDIRMLNIEKMPPEMRLKLSVGVTRLSGRLIQKQFVGDTSAWMNKWLGKCLTQFKTFSIVSAEKQLIHDIKGDKIKAAQILGWSSLIGTIAYGTRVHLDALGQKDPDKYIEERMTDRNVAYGVFNMSPQLSSLGLGLDFMATMKMLPDDMYAAPGKGGARPMALDNVAPLLSTGKDTVDLATSAIGLLTGDSDGYTVAKKAHRVAAGLRSVGIGQIVNKGISALED